MLHPTALVLQLPAKFLAPRRLPSQEGRIKGEHPVNPLPACSDLGKTLKCNHLGMSHHEWALQLKTPVRALCKDAQQLVWLALG